MSEATGTLCHVICPESFLERCQCSDGRGALCMVETEVSGMTWDWAGVFKPSSASSFWQACMINS